MNIPLQQTKKWQNLQNSLGETTFFEQNNDYTYLAIKKQTRFGTYLYLPYGPYANTKNGAKKAYEALQRLSQQKNIIFIRIEPQTPQIADFWLNLPNCHKSRNLSPEETWILDLSPSLADLYAGMKQNTRNLCKNYKNKGISVKISKNPIKDVKILANFHRQVAKSKKIGAFSEDYLAAEAAQDFASLFIAEFKGQPIASSLFFDFEGTRFYMQSASDPNFRKLPGTYAIINEAIVDAKQKGLKKLDFWGIAPDGAKKSHPWAGFTAFKKSFGGTEQKYFGTHDVVFNPVKYQIYNLARRGNLFLRKLKNR